MRPTTCTTHLWLGITRKRLINFLKIIVILVLFTALIVMFQFYEENVEVKGKKTRKKLKKRLNITWLADNPVYRKFRIKEAKQKKRVTVLVIVSSGPRRIDRRNAIRKTWWKQCKQTGMVTPECIFMTDYLHRNETYYETTQSESKRYGDIYFQHVPGGITFGLRLLNHMVFAVNKYEFDYFLRVDDDYFMCFENFVNEIPLPPLQGFHWGWVHNSNRDIVRPEESMLLLSRDLIEEFLLQDPYTIMCHPLADQMIGVWSNSLNLKRVWRHDNRLWHHPPSRDTPGLSKMADVCHKYIGLHGTYPEHMNIFWKKRGKYKSHGGNLMTNSKVCPLTKPFRWDKFIYTWRYEPKRCITSPYWDTSKQGVQNGSYTGREDVINIRLLPHYVEIYLTNYAFW